MKTDSMSPFARSVIEDEDESDSDLSEKNQNEER